MEQGFDLFSHWTFESFAPGSISRLKYDAFRQIQENASACLRLLGEIEALDAVLADWARVSALIDRLSVEIGALVERLRIMNPVEFMDVRERFAKVDFYVRLAMDRAEEKSGPPYVRECSSWSGECAWLRDFLDGGERTAALVVSPALYQYFVEVNALRHELERALCACDPADPARLAAVEEEARALLHAGRLPRRLADELEIAAVDLAPGGGLLDVWSFIGTGDRRDFLGGERGVRAADMAGAWKRAVARKFSPEAQIFRLNRGLADGEDGVTVVAHISKAADPRPAVPTVPDAAAFRSRLRGVLPQVTHLHVFRGEEESVHPDQCRSLYDLLCLCLDRGLSQVFAFAGEPGKGMAGVKRMRLDVPVTVDVFNLEDAFFPSVAERAVISVEDVRSIPAWSFLLGLACPAVSWPPFPQEKTALRHHGSYAVLSQFFMHCTLRLKRNLFAVECHCSDHAEKYIRFCFKGVCRGEGGQSGRREILRRILEDEGFLVHTCGEYLEAVRTAGDDVPLQRNLVCLGVLVAWIQTSGERELEALEPERGLEAFRTLLAGTVDQD